MPDNKISQSLEARDRCLEFTYRSEIWQASRQYHCRDACQISERYECIERKSRGFETLRDLIETVPGMSAGGRCLLCAEVYDAATKRHITPITTPLSCASPALQWHPATAPRQDPTSLAISRDKSWESRRREMFVYGYPEYGARERCSIPERKKFIWCLHDMTIPYYWPLMRGIRANTKTPQCETLTFPLLLAWRSFWTKQSSCRGCDLS